MLTVSLMTSLLTIDCSRFCRRNAKRLVADEDTITAINVITIVIMTFYRLLRRKAATV